MLERSVEADEVLAVAGLLALDGLDRGGEGLLEGEGGIPNLIAATFLGDVCLTLVPVESF